MTRPLEIVSADPIPISDLEFERLRALVRRGSGIVVPDAKQALLVARLQRRVRACGLTSFAEYIAHLDRGSSAEQQHLVEAMCTHETHFFREPKHFDLLAEKVFPAWRAAAAEGRRPRRARAWSAACSTGEEAYTIAMCMLAHLPGFDLEVVATDISRRALAQAQLGVYPIDRAEEIPRPHLLSYMLKGHKSQAAHMKVGPELRNVVRFKQVNLHADAHSVGGAFDLVFCRNVLIYFDAPGRRAVVERLLRHLGRGGLLFVGHAESMTGTTLPISSVMPTVYLRRGDHVDGVRVLG